jgi:hypothetical protein
MFRVLRLCLIVIAGLSIASCSKEKSVEKNTGGSGSLVNGVLKMKIDGQQWVADAAAGATVESGIIGIYGISKDKKQFVITLSGTASGTYKLDQVLLNAAALTDSNDTNLNAFASNQGDSTQAGGTVIITKIDQDKKTISGTFQIKVFREMDNKGKVLTEGIFEDLSFAPVEPPSTGGPGGQTGGGDTLKVKLNGADMNISVVAGISASGVITIVGTETATSRSVGLVIPANITPGQYNIGSLGATYMGTYNSSSTQYLVSESGKLTITEHNTATKRIRGSFEFKAVEVTGGNQSAQLTAGYLSLTYR